MEENVNEEEFDIKSVDGELPNDINTLEETKEEQENITDEEEEAEEQTEEEEEIDKNQQIQDLITRLALEHPELTDEQVQRAREIYKDDPRSIEEIEQELLELIEQMKELEKDIPQISLGELGAETAIFHLTTYANLKNINEVGIEGKIVDNTSELEETPKVYFSKGTDGMLELCDVWLKFQMNKAYSDSNDYNSYNKLSQEEALKLQDDWSKEFINKEYLNDEDKKQKIYEDFYKEIQERTYLVLDLKENEDYLLNDIDENKKRNIDLYNKGDKTNLIYMKEVYGPYSNITSPVMDKWNMHTKPYTKIEKTKIKQVTTKDGKTDSLSIVMETYTNYKKEGTKYEMLDGFVLYAKQKKSIENTQELNNLKELKNDVLKKKDNKDLNSMLQESKKSKELQQEKTNTLDKPKVLTLNRNTNNINNNTSNNSSTSNSQRGAINYLMIILLIIIIVCIAIVIINNM